MTGISDLAQLLASMRPVLHDAPYGIVTVAGGSPPAGTFATVAEEEGLTLIAPTEALTAAGHDPGPPWARISLSVHSDLAAVGLTAAFARALADRGISANVVAGFHHDHIFVQWPLRAAALDALKGLSHA